LLSRHVVFDPVALRSAFWFLFLHEAIAFRSSVTGKNPSNFHGMDCIPNSKYVGPMRQRRLAVCEAPSSAKALILTTPVRVPALQQGGSLKPSRQR